MFLNDLIAQKRDDTIDIGASIDDALQKIANIGYSYLVIIDKNIPAGIVNSSQLAAMTEESVDKSSKVIDFAHFQVITIHHNRPVEMALEMMTDHKTHYIVLLNEHDEYIGTLTRQDILSYCSTLKVSDRDRLLGEESHLCSAIESKLRDAKATFNLLGIAYVEILDIGDEHIIRWLNAEAMMIFGVKIDDPVTKMLTPSVWEQLMDIFISYGGVEHERIEVHGRIYEVTLMDAELLGRQIMKLFLNDVTELVRLGDELRHTLERTIELEQEKNNLYLDVASVLFLALDSDGNISLINPKGCEILGIRKGEAIGKNWFDTFVLPEEASYAKQLYSDIISGKCDLVEQYENKVRTKNGELRTIVWHNALLKDESGKVIGTFSSGEDITQIKESEEKIEHIVHYDPLTDLPNRLLLRARLDHAIAHAKRQHQKVAVIYINIDHFKDINESYGYGVGDAIIVKTAAMLGSVIRQEDTLARVGGDEFIVILEELNDIVEGEIIAKKIQGCFEGEIAAAENSFTLSISSGIAIYPEDGESSDVLVKHADIALRRVKEEGRNNYCFFSSDMSSKLFERVLLERELRRAVEQKEFLVYYQPQIDLKSGKVCGAEALVRWKHPSMGVVSPDVFITLCETNSLIIPIGEQILEKACQEIRVWKEQGLFPGRISVNVSGKQFERSDAVETITAIVKRSGLDPNDLELEITESVMMGDPMAFGKKLIELKKMGIEIAIDDFGTGYSSLSYLKQFPIDKLKIDQSFVRGIPDDEHDMAIIKAIIAMSEAFGFHTIAEGIEGKPQEEFLKNCGCEQGQGYLYARPLNSEKFEEFLKGKV